MSTEDWRTKQWKLRQIFTTDGIVGRNLMDIDQEEEQFERWACEQFKGYRLVHQCFLSFLYKTVEQAEKISNTEPISPRYRPLLLFVANVFSRARAAEVLFLHGYSLDAFALLRDLKDRALYLSAVLRGISTVERILGFPEGDENDDGRDYWESARVMAARRRKEHRRIHQLLVGKESGLPEAVIADIGRWERLFHDEVHVSFHSFALGGEAWSSGRGGLPLGVPVALEAHSLYMNRSLEVAWCLLRTLPILQLHPGRFGSEWVREWRSLDDNLRMGVTSLSESGVKLVTSLVALIDTVFNYTPTNHFVLDQSSPEAHGDKGAET